MREAYARVVASQSDLELCGQAETAEDALEMIGGALCDLVVTDLRLPGMSGIDLVALVRDRWPALPVVVITGHEDDVFERQAQQAGAVAFLPKRLAPTRLLPTIRQALSGTAAA